MITINRDKLPVLMRRARLDNLTDLARRMGMGRTQVYKILRAPPVGKSASLSLATLDRLCLALSASPSDLLLWQVPDGAVQVLPDCDHQYARDMVDGVVRCMLCLDPPP